MTSWTLSTLERISTQLLASSLPSQPYLTAHLDKSFAIMLENQPPLYATIIACDHLLWSREAPEMLALTMKGPLTAFIGASKRARKGQSTLGAGLVLEGDIAFAQDLQACAAAFEIDLSEALAPYLGDTVSVWAARAGKRLFQKAKQWAQTSVEVSLDHLQRPSGTLPHRSEYLQWASRVRACALEADRLNANIEHFQAQQEPHDECD